MQLVCFQLAAPGMRSSWLVLLNALPLFRMLGNKAVFSGSRNFMSALKTALNRDITF